MASKTCVWRKPRYFVRLCSMACKSIFGMLICLFAGCSSHKSVNNSVVETSNSIRGVDSTMNPGIDLLGWKQETGALRCLATGTQITLPNALRSASSYSPEENKYVVVPLGASSIAPSMAGLMVRSSRSKDQVQNFIVDWSELQHLLTPPVSQQTVVQGDLVFEKGHLRVEYTIPIENSDVHYRLVYKVISRNGVHCRITVIDHISTRKERGQTVVFNWISDSPGLEVMNVRQVRRYEDPAWANLRAVLSAGSHLLLNR